VPIPRAAAAALFAVCTLPTAVLSQAPASSVAVADWRGFVRAATSAFERNADATDVADSAVANAARRMGASSDVARRLGQATLARLRYRYAESDSQYNWLIANAEPPVRLQARMGQVLALGIRSRATEAARAVNAAIADARAQADTLTLADALQAASTIRARTGGARAMLATMDTLRAVLPSVRIDSTAHAAFACGLLRQLSPNDSAPYFRALRSAADLADRHDAPRVAAQCVLIAGAANISALRHEAGRRLLDSAYNRAKGIGDRATMASAGQWGGFSHVSLGDLLGARDILARAVRDAERAGAISVLGWATMNSAQVVDGLGDHARAMSIYRRAAVFMRDAEDGAGAATVRGMELGMAFQGAPTPSMRALIDEQLRAAAQSGSAQSYQATLELDAFARALAGDAAGAWRADSLAVEVERTIGERTRAMANKRHGLLLLALHRARESIPYLHRVVESFGPDQPRFRFASRLQLALAFAEADDAAAAAREALDANDEFDRWRASLSTLALRTMAFQLNYSFYGPDVTAPRVIAALAASGRAEDALRLAEAGRARAVVDALSGIESVPTSVSAASSNGGSSAASVARATATAKALPPLAARTAMLHITAGKDSVTPTTVIVRTAQGTRAFRAPALVTLLPRIERWSALLQGNQPDSPLAIQLGDALFSALARALPADVQSLVIVPDGALHQLPFASLIVNGRRLGDRYAVSIAPSATALAIVQNRPVAPRTSRALLIANPTRAADAVDGVDFAPLPGAEREVRAVASLFDDTDVRIGALASKRAILNAPMDSYTIAHFALHSVIDDRAVDGSMLVMGGDGSTEGLLSSQELRHSTLTPDLVVLSACRSAGGITLDGEGVRGLPTTFISMGARAVIATLWDVRDGDAEQIVVPFYKALRRGASVAVALQTAQREARARGASAQAWAGFVVIGDGDFRLSPSPAR
jgi:CHAT domain-containing protein